MLNQFLPSPFLATEVIFRYTMLLSLLVAHLGTMTLVMFPKSQPSLDALAWWSRQSWFAPDYLLVLRQGFKMEHRLALNLWASCQVLGRQAHTHYALACKGCDGLRLLHTSISMLVHTMTSAERTCSLLLPASALQWFQSSSLVAPWHCAQLSTEEQSYRSSLFAYLVFNSLQIP